MADKVRWQVLECERALYVDRGRNVILCDRLPTGPVTLVVKLGPTVDSLREEDDDDSDD